MSSENEALRLADLWEKHSHGYARTPEARTAACLRRQHAEIESLTKERDALRAEVSALQSQVNAFYLGTPESRLLAMTKERDALRVELDAMTNRAREAENDRQDVFDSYANACNQLVETEAECYALRAILLRLRAWDAMDAAADGAFWRREIDAALKEAGK